MVTATLTGDCRYMSLVLQGEQGMAQVTVSNGQLSYQASVNLPPANATYNTVLDLLQSVGTRDGIFEISMTDSAGNVTYTAALGKCALLCCISKKMDTILGCDCGCTKCQLALTQANRVNLLIVGVEAALATLTGSPTTDAGIISSAKEKYDKAVSLCTDSCGCGC